MIVQVPFYLHNLCKITTHIFATLHFFLLQHVTITIHRNMNKKVPVTIIIIITITDDPLLLRLLLEGPTKLKTAWLQGKAIKSSTIHTNNYIHMCGH